ncbi:MAG: cohesin domain-containing protein [Dehalococcoidia bacterium]|nr:cohesin domain-containing protein [Dehalococcoidia bacterium]
MAKGCAGKLAGRLVLALAVCGLLAMIEATLKAEADGPEGAVLLAPVVAEVPAAEDRFRVDVVVNGFQHVGAIGYDDNDDGTSDRFEESIGLGAFEFSLEYDPAVFAFEDVEIAPAGGLEGADRSFQCLTRQDEANSVQFGCISVGKEPGPQGTLTLATVTFEVLGPGVSWLPLEAELSGPLGDHAPVQAAGGIARVLAAGEAGAQGSDGGASGNGGGQTDSPSPAQATEEAAAQATAVSGRGSTSGAGTPADGGSSGSGQEPSGGEDVRRDVEGERSGPAGADGRSDGNTALWLIVGFSGFAVLGVTAATAVLWRRARGGV